MACMGGWLHTIECTKTSHWLSASHVWATISVPPTLLIGSYQKYIHRFSLQKSFSFDVQTAKEILLSARILPCLEAMSSERICTIKACNTCAVVHLMPSSLTANAKRMRIPCARTEVDLSLTNLRKSTTIEVKESKPNRLCKCVRSRPYVEDIICLAKACDHDRFGDVNYVG